MNGLTDITEKNSHSGVLDIWFNLFKFKTDKTNL